MAEDDLKCQEWLVQCELLLAYPFCKVADFLTDLMKSLFELYAYCWLYFTMCCLFASYMQYAIKKCVMGLSCQFAFILFSLTVEPTNPKWWREGLGHPAVISKHALFVLVNFRGLHYSHAIQSKLQFLLGFRPLNPNNPLWTWRSLFVFSPLNILDLKTECSTQVWCTLAI